MHANNLNLFSFSGYLLERRLYHWNILTNSIRFTRASHVLSLAILCTVGAAFTPAIANLGTEGFSGATLDAIPALQSAMDRV